MAEHDGPSYIRPLTDLPPSEWSIDYFSLDPEGGRSRSLIPLCHTVTANVPIQINILRHMKSKRMICDTGSQNLNIPGHSISLQTLTPLRAMRQSLT